MADEQGDLQHVQSVSVVVYAVFLVVSLWRTGVLLQAAGQAAAAAAAAAGGAKGRLRLSAERAVFHAFAVLYGACELASAVDQQGHHVLFTVAGYELHLLALWLQAAALSLVVMLWAKALLLDRCRSPLVKCLLVLDALLLLASLAAMGLISSGYNSSGGSTGAATRVAQTASSRLFFGYAVLATATLLVFSASLLVYGVKLQLNFTSNSRWEQTARRERRRILLRMNGVLALCSACFAVRVGLVSVLLASQRLGRPSLVGFWDGHPMAWYSLSEWLPGPVATAALLFLMRPPRPRGAGGRGRGGGGQGHGEGAQPLLASPKLASNAAFDAAFVNSPTWGGANDVARLGSVEAPGGGGGGGGGGSHLRPPYAQGGEADGGLASKLSYAPPELKV
jgi:hypothetical protein